MIEAQYDAEVMEARLDNWGAWCRRTVRRSGSSQLYRILLEMGYTQENATAERCRMSSIDERDAVVLNTVICSLPDGIEKRYLFCRYVRRNSGDGELGQIRKKWRPYVIDGIKRMVFRKARKQVHSLV